MSPHLEVSSIIFFLLSLGQVCSTPTIIFIQKSGAHLVLMGSYTQVGIPWQRTDISFLVEKGKGLLDLFGLLKEIID